MSRQGNFDPGIILIVVAIVVLGVAGWLLYQNVRTDEVTARVEDGEVVRVLFVVEREDRPLFSEVVLLQPDSNRAALFDIPNDLGAIIDELNRVDRVRALYSEGRLDAYRAEIEQLLGVSVPFHIALTMEDLGNVVDLLGGLEMFVAESFGGGQDGGGQTLPSGNVLLDGRLARKYATYESNTETRLQRVGRNQKFVQAFLARLGARSDYLHAGNVRGHLVRFMRTNMSERAVLSYTRELSELSLDSVITRRVQGTYRQVDIQGETRRLLFPHFEGQWLRQTVRQVEQSLASSDAVETPNRSISVEILNGTTRNGLAARTRSLYEGYGFNVVGIGNAENQQREQTVVISHESSPKKAEQVADIIRAPRVRTQPPAEQNPKTADVTVILGEDFDGTYVGEE
jgi:anionic cell wall polymer biosynthesis LytR-Cps2A-Psr (LCP) family protein